MATKNKPSTEVHQLPLTTGEAFLLVTLIGVANDDDRVSKGDKARATWLVERILRECGRPAVSLAEAASFAESAE